MKHYLVEIETRNGEYEYTDNIIVDAKDDKDFDKKIGKAIETAFSRNDNDKWDDEIGLDRGDEIITWRGHQEITDEEAKTLDRLLSIYTY